jgi:NAD(P)-dependent dehydrogenase (short-subunit alcohol dehydrogenase family)
VIDNIKAISSSTAVHFVHVDLSLQTSVRKAAAEILALNMKVDVMLNNAGIMALHTFQKSADGIEMQFATNHVGHFLLTCLLLPILVKGGRVVNVSSAGHALGDVRFNDVTFEDGKVYEEWAAYGQGKCANVLFARSLAAKGITAFSLHPGNIHETGLGENLVDPDWPYVMSLFEKLGRKPPGTKTISEGTSTILAACLDPKLVKDSGSYLDDCAVGESTAFSSDMGNAEKLWELSEELVGEKFVI